MESLELRQPDPDSASTMDSKGAQTCVNKGRLFTWGLGKSGQLGTGQDKTQHTPQPCKLMCNKGRDVSSLKQVVCGGLFTAVLTEDGYVLTTGCGKYGRLASGDEEDKALFSQADLQEKVKHISCGSWHGAAVTVTASLLVWGHRKGCGTESMAKSSKASSVILPSPLVLPNEPKVAGVACGHNFTLVWTVEGKVLSWGSGHNGVLGHGSTQDVMSPQAVTALKDDIIMHISAGYCNSAFVTQDGRLFMCGKGKDGAVGLGKTHLADVTTPALVTFPDSVHVVQVSSSVGEHHGHTLALTSNGRVYSWGDGYKGKLGLGSQDTKYTPTLIPSSCFSEERVTVVCAGGIHSAAATAEGNVYTWGCGSDGRMGHPEGQGHRYLFRSDVPK